MHDAPVILITGARKGIGRGLAGHYARLGYRVHGCSRSPFEGDLPNYRHHCLDVCDEAAVRELFTRLRREEGRLDVLVNNAGIAAMNHSLLMPLEVVRRIFDTNVAGTFLFCREAARLMQPRKFGRIVNFASVAAPLKLEGEAAYAASKAAVISLTQILAREFAGLGITVNAIGPTPVETDLIRNVPRDKIDRLIERQAIRRFGEQRDVENVVDFFVRAESDFVTGQVIFLGGV